MTLIASPRERTEADWSRCGQCGMLNYTPRLRRSLGVCPECSDHQRLTAPQRIAHLFDEGSAEELELFVASGDPLRFADSLPYPQRIARTRAATGLDEAVVCVRGTVHGHPLIAAVMDFRFLGGSLGAATGDLITGAAETALRERTPFLMVTASGGARMQEGAIALMQMAKVSAALGQLDAAGVLTISLVTDPTFGGVAASFATLGDVIVAEQGARLGFAGPRVIEQTIRESLPDGFQRAEGLFKRGLIDRVCDRSALRPLLARLVSVLRTDAGSPAPGPAPALVKDVRELTRQDPWSAVRGARELARPTTLDYASALLDGFEELHGDRASADCPSIIAGLGRLGGQPVALIGHQKGHSVSEVTNRNFGMATPAGYRKAMRLMRLAAKLGIPLVTLVDTPGAFPGVEAEENGQAVAIAESLRLMSGLPVPVVSVITGEGGSGGALAIAVADRVIALSGAVYSVISPEGCAAILWGDAALAPRAAAALRITAADLLELGVVDAVVVEPDGGAHEHPGEMAGRLGDALRATLAEVTGIAPTALIEQRCKRFKGFTAAGVAP